MAITHSTTTRNALANAVDAAVNTGGAGSLEFQTSASATGVAAGSTAEVATITFDTTAFGDAVSGTVTATSMPQSDTTPTGGTVGAFTIFDGNDLRIMSGTVAVSGGDINLSSLTISTGDTVTLNSLTYTAPV